MENDKCVLVVKNEANEEQIAGLKEMFPNSTIVKECDVEDV